MKRGRWDNVTAEDRFFTKVDKSADCWLWKGSKTSDGYGTFWNGKPNVKAHRASYEMFVGPIPEGMCVCHRCDTPLCVNPNHLFLGTFSDNAKDMTAKGRRAACERHWKAKLTWEQVRLIRSRDDGSTAITGKLAREFGVAHDTIRRILNGTGWKEQSS